MPRDVRKIYFDILHAIEGIEEFTRDKTLEDYQSNRMLRLAVEREYEIIGEAIKRLESEFAASFSNITDGRKMIDFRNILIHGYDSISDDIVWSITQNNLKTLKNEIERLHKEV